ncbi:SRPBCC family protein [Streptacidiphilus carbonis]|jgi:uncharacterized protein YndB with AHSA1/START domain|uniref:SRPBCC family protein n=1 Tax=Streptacidiphilus carbonis TaxID=105422 RepID=UPI0005AB5F17|nr:SRPBCC domain-containing protein [Streptacidiphilus carbonis]
MSEIHIVRDYPQAPQQVWRAVTDPQLVPLWTATGAGARPEGFEASVGARFKFVAKPKPGWSGVVVCTVLEVREPELLRFSWQDEGGGAVTDVAYRLEALGSGTRFTYDHTGFTGPGGFVMAKILGNVRTKMLTQGLTAVLNELDDSGNLRPDSVLRRKQFH